MTHTPQPLIGTMLTIDGRPVKRGLADLDGGFLYPLTARCETCGERSVCMDGTAEWAHLSDPGGSGSFAEYYDHYVTDRADVPAGGGSFYVRRERFEPCDMAASLAGRLQGGCRHTPRCREVRGTFGRWREGWTGPIRSVNTIRREARAWRQAGTHDFAWQVDIRPAYPATRAAVAAWQRAADKRLGRLAGDKL